MTVKFLGDQHDISTFGNIIPNDINLVSTFGWIGGGVHDSIAITNHTERALSLLIEEFKHRVNIVKLIKVMVDQAQEIEDMENDLLTDRRLDQAADAQLDIIGDIVGEDREGRSDEDYRAAIRFKIYINVSHAEPETLIAAIKFITIATRVRLWEIQPATVLMYTDGSVVPTDIVSFMELVAAGGVNLEYVASSFGTTPFSFTLDDLTDNPEGAGWNELGYTPGGIEVGGQWVEGFFT
ncbi:hypothetical protein KAR91_48680 [Candidatus Pacearchaeota archaeon]|nr:hypothetical protein [Candidatus Pacearchaeota archaeon]